MNINSLYFFDKNGENLNLEQVDSVWKGTIYFEPISTYLFNNENIFILEKVGLDYRFPVLSPNQYFKFSWNSTKNSNEFFIYEVKRDFQLRESFISKLDQFTVSYSELNPSGTSPLDIKAPLQINIAFNPTVEIKYERTLSIYIVTNQVETKFAEIGFYGEGVEEDERFKIWAQNFGIKFLKEDANILKDYDIKEAVPDWQKVNQARKELLVSKEHVYPYIGTYKGLSNFINLLGYKDVLKVKEYWRNTNNISSGNNQYRLVDISDYLDDGIIDSLEVGDVNNNRVFKKTEFLALVYQFTRETSDFDDDGVPIVEETTQFTVNEIFYKLNGLSEKLKAEIIPVNVKIKDVIGEFIYFQKITLSLWTDDTRIFDVPLNQEMKVNSFPQPKTTEITIRTVDPLFRAKEFDGLDFGLDRLNFGTVDPYEFNQKYTQEQNLQLIEYVESYYTSVKNQRAKNVGQRLAWETGDEPQRNIATPVVLSIDIQKILIQDLKGVKLEDLTEIYPGLNQYWTLENISFKNFYEIEWVIEKKAPNPYSFSYRGKVVDLYKLAHFLPYSGDYKVTAKVYDFYGNSTVISSNILIEATKPHIVGFTRLEDKFDYHVGNLSNVQLQDFGASPLYYPKVNVLSNEGAINKIDIYKNLLEWISFYKNRYGLGQNILDAELYDPISNSYVPFTSTTQNNPKKSYWGLGEDGIPLTLKDFRNIELGSLYWLRLTNLIHLDDFNAGFYIRNPKAGEKIKASLYSDYALPSFSSLEELVDKLNDSEHPFISMFIFEIINGRKSDGQYIIHAQARFLSKITYHILSEIGGFSPSPKPSPSPSGSGSKMSIDKYTFFLPRKTFSKGLIDYLKALSPVFEDETMFLLAKTSDVLSGAVQDPGFWKEQKYWDFNNDVQRGHLPSTIDQNAFNISDIKIFDETFIMPQNNIGFFVVNNIDGKSEFIWTLSNTISGEEIIRVKSVPFFVWKFKDLGKFSLSVRIYDNRKNEYFGISENLINVFDKKQYIRYTEDQLNTRKLKLTQGRVSRVLV
jgi:hypothetical protein